MCEHETWARIWLIQRCTNPSIQLLQPIRTIRWATVCGGSFHWLSFSVFCKHLMTILSKIHLSRFFSHNCFRAWYKKVLRDANKMWENCISAAVNQFLIISRSICNNKIEPSIAIDITCTPPQQPPPPNSSITLEPFIVCYDGNTRHESKYTNILLGYEMRASWNSIARETPKGNNNKEDDVKNATTKTINENFRFRFKSVEIAGGMYSISALQCSLFDVQCASNWFSELQSDWFRMQLWEATLCIRKWLRFLIFWSPPDDYRSVRMHFD